MSLLIDLTKEAMLLVSKNPKSPILASRLYKNLTSIFKEIYSGVILNESSEVATVYATETAFRYLNHYSEKYLKGSELSKDVKIAMYKKYNLNTKLVADKKIKKFSKLILNGFIGYDAKEFGCSIVGVKSPIYPNPNNLTQWTGENFLDLNIYKSCRS